MSADWSDDIVVANLADEPALSDELGALLQRVESCDPQDTPWVVLNFGDVTYVNSSNIAQMLRLRTLLDPITPSHNGAPLNLTIGEPQGGPPAWMNDIITENAHLWGKYPPVDGTPEYRQACKNWLTRRYGEAAMGIDPERQILAVPGTKETLYFLADFLTPKNQPGAASPLALLPNPAYMVYEGAGVMAGAKLHYLPATAETVEDYPLARFLWLSVNYKPNSQLEPLRREFIKYIFSQQGQEAVVKDGYIPVPAVVAKRALSQVGIQMD